MGERGEVRMREEKKEVERERGGEVRENRKMKIRERERKEKANIQTGRHTDIYTHTRTMAEVGSV